MKRHPLATAVGLGTLLLMTACDDDSSNNSQASPEPKASMSVTAIDGYLRKADVWLDVTPNYVQDSNEPAGVTGEGGKVELDVTGIASPESYPIIVKAKAGVTVDEDSPDKPISGGFVMSAPAGETDVTPLSTLVHIKMKTANQSKELASKELADELGIESDEVLGDFTQNKAVANKASAMVKAELLPKTLDEMEDNAKGEATDVLDSFDASKAVIKDLQEEETIIVDGSVYSKATDDDDDDDDGVKDQDDVFPNNAQEWRDTDGDGYGDEVADKFPNDQTEWADKDGDNHGDNEDDLFPDNSEEWADADGDGYGDNLADKFPEDKTEWADKDGDLHGDNHNDKFPDDVNEWADADEDGYGDNLADKFPEDKTEWADGDEDGYGDNHVDKFPGNSDEWADADGDGYGDNLADQFPDDAEKSAADVTTSKQFSGPVMVQLLNDVRELKTDTSTVVETLNNGDIRTTQTVTYQIADGNQYFGKEVSVDVLHSSGEFYRQTSWDFDYNQDGNAQYKGKSLDRGNRTETGETLWRYIDEDNAKAEGGDNGPNPREFNNINLLAQIDAKNLTGIDVIQYVIETKATQVNSETLDTTDTVTTVVEQYPISEFDFDAESHTADYSCRIVNTLVNHVQNQFEESRDWQADGTTNASFRLTIGEAGAYTFAYQRPIWPNPHGVDFEEYAHFNYVQGKHDVLGPYWYEVNREVTLVDGLKMVSQSGQRYLLDQVDNRHVKLTDETNPNGVIFNQYHLQKKDVSVTENTESVEWSHFALADSYFNQPSENFTAVTDDIGQDYKIYQQLDNGMWLGHRFAEWGSQNVGDLAGKVESLRQNGHDLSQITTIELPGLSSYDSKLLTSSFRIDEAQQPVTWHLITNHAAFTGNDDGSYQLIDITLVDNGIKQGWLASDDGAGTLIIAIPTTDEPWNWYDAYSRMVIGINTVSTTPALSWTSWVGEFYLNQEQANLRAKELGIGVKEYTVCTDGDSQWDEVNDVPVGNPSYDDFLTTATQCEFEATSQSVIGGAEYYRLNSRGELRHWVFNENGTGTYYRNGYPDGDFTWTINSDGIVVVDFGNGDLDYFAYVSSDDSRISFKTYSVWTENEQVLKDISSSGFTYQRPEDYTVRSCDVKQSDATVEDFNAAVEQCGDHHVITGEDTAEIADTMFVRVRADGDTRAYKFNADNSLSYFRAGENRVSSTRTWALTSEGYLKLWDSTNPDEYMLLANLLFSDEQSSFVTYDVYQEDGAWVRDIWSFVFREYEEPITECQTGNTPWDEANDQPSAYKRIADFYDAVSQCQVKTDDKLLQFTEDMLVGSQNKTSTWSLMFLQSNEGETPSYVEDEQLRFNPDHTGAFIDAEDGEFAFNWQINEGHLILNMTHSEYVGSTETMSIVETDGEYFSVKSFWIDTSGEWDNPAPQEGEGEILSLIFKQISKQ
ncbi:hypothetical protein C942_00700 [Photobacterium marinum]|uniref:Uncharacterized protein n=1 Tax=Photobacterium marinum TaxID=1056511 RepID=L8JDY1_9GAMM|nr:hypothetical protein [Photobacterium marinum]ELR65617.1 hypothetical protein C942_00700 [Photobacterium marinum]